MAKRRSNWEPRSRAKAPEVNVAAAQFALVASLLLALLLSSCGEASTTAPTPEIVASAEAGSIAVAIAAPDDTDVTGEDASGVVLQGRIFGSGPVGVILAHMRPADQTAWFPFATRLAATGTFTVLTFDFRGFGKSTGEKEFDHLDTDLAAAYRYVSEQLGIPTIFLIGASMGGTASLVEAGRLPVAGVVSISSPAQFETLDALHAVQSGAIPRLFIASEDDVPAARSQEQFWANASDPKERQIYPGNAHGTDLFKGDQRLEVEQRIIDFLSSH